MFLCRLLHFASYDVLFSIDVLLYSYAVCRPPPFTEVILGRPTRWPSSVVPKDASTSCDGSGTIFSPGKGGFNDTFYNGKEDLRLVG